MNSPTIPARAAAIAGGLGLISAAAWLTIEHTGGFDQPHARLVAAMAVALVAGAVAITQARGLMAVAIFAGLVAGEAYGVLTTAERMIVVREAQQAPARAAGRVLAAADARVTKAETAVAQAAATALAKAAERDCARNCRALIEQAKADAAAELNAARSARAALPPVADAAPLAARLGIAAWALDLIVVGLAAVGANGLGAILVAFGVHPACRPVKTPVVDFQPVRVSISDDTMIDGQLPAATLFSGDLPDPPPPGKRAPAARLPANVVSIAGKRGQRGARSEAASDEASVVAALASVGGSVASNRELAVLMGVSEGESSKRCRAAAHLLDFQPDGRHVRISLKARPRVAAG